MPCGPTLWLGQNTPYSVLSWDCTYCIKRIITFFSYFYIFLLCISFSFLHCVSPFSAKYYSFSESDLTLFIFLLHLFSYLIFISLSFPFSIWYTYILWIWACYSHTKFVVPTVHITKLIFYNIKHKTVPNIFTLGFIYCTVTHSRQDVTEAAANWLYGTLLLGYVCSVIFF